MARVRHNAGVISFGYEQTPNAAQVYQDIMWLENAVSDYNKPLRWAKQIIVKDVEKTFRLEREPDSGHRWPNWSRDYEAVARRHGQKKKLRRNWGPHPGALFRAATSPRTYRIHPTGIEVNTSAFPTDEKGTPYWVFHQQPDNDTESLIQRTQQSLYGTQKYAAIAKTAKAKYGVKAARGIVITRARKEAEELVEAGAGDRGTIPRRRFLGVSKFAAVEIRRGFDDWANNTVNFFHRRDTRVYGKSMIVMQRTRR